MKLEILPDLCPCGSERPKGKCAACLPRNWCKVHFKRRDKCNFCLGPIPHKKCVHGKRRELCAICKGGSLCACGRRKTRCKKCHPLMFEKTRARAMVKRAFEKLGVPKNAFSEDMLGCTFKEFSEYIDQKIRYWNLRYANKIYKHRASGSPGSLHLDHIKPLDKAKTIEELRELTHYTNIQPLPFYLNLEKGHKWSDLDDELWRNNILYNTLNLKPYWPVACPVIFLPDAVRDKNLYMLAECAAGLQ